MTTERFSINGIFLFLNLLATIKYFAGQVQVATFHLRVANPLAILLAQFMKFYRIVDPTTCSHSHCG